MLLFLRIYIAISCLAITSNFAKAQSIDHWESAIYNTDTWSYYIGDDQVPNSWNAQTFDATSWATGSGGFGYGDNDDNTTIAQTTSIFIRKEFNISSISSITSAILHADYDDGFVAYLNGTEIARGNMAGNPPAYDALATDIREAELYQGGLPQEYMMEPALWNSLITNGANTLAIQIHNRSATSSDMSSNFFLSLSINNTSRLYRTTPSWFVAPPVTSSSLPLIIITTENSTEIQDDPKVFAKMGIVDNGPGNMNNLTDPYNGYNGTIGIEIRGASSQSFPKKNYGLETRNTDGSNNNVSLLGMPAENDWVLHGPYSDKSLLRNSLAYHMGTSTGKYTPRTRLCELYINDNYRGIYMLTERIKRDKNRVDIASLKPEDLSGEELTGGYILQIDRDDESSNIDGWYSGSSPTKFYSYHDPKAEDLEAVQREYLKTYLTSFEEDMESTDYYWKYKSYVDVPSWIDYFLVTEMGKHIDAYKLSFYMHKKKSTNGGKLHFGPLWDFNLGFGNFNFVCSPEPEGWTYEFQGTCDNSHPFWVKKLTDIPEVSDQINCRWNKLRNGPLHIDSLMQYIDARIAEMGDAPSRNFERWNILGQYVWPNDFVGDTYEEEVDFLKTWLTTRLTWMDNNMLGECTITSTDNPKTTYKATSIFPNPAQHSFFLEINASQFDAGSIQIINNMGSTVLEINSIKTLQKIDISTFAAGIYTVNVFTNSQLLETQKLSIY
ncbi:MAG: CotH kinase family protein [Bacteroidota bacterium]